MSKAKMYFFTLWEPFEKKKPVLAPQVLFTYLAREEGNFKGNSYMRGKKRVFSPQLPGSAILCEEK